MGKAFSVLLAGWVAVLGLQAEEPRPNVVFVITDDQGYGDLGCSGNPAIQTPCIDRLAKEGVRLENYHVDPTCAPSRAALLTGRYSDRVGVWHTVQGRNLLRRRETTMAEIFRANGYATGLFGKWHLGDAYPYRPDDRGFDRAVWHAAGGVGQAPDYWGNDYFDDTYFRDGKPERFEGYCTDVWFREGIRFIRECAASGKPFFAYIAPNAPHGPLYCPAEYARPFKGKPGVSTPEFYGMVRNIDDNMARLVKVLDELGVARNTMLVFTTDNGTAGGLAGGRGFNAGMRGMKGSEYDGGHRVPFIVRWPAGGLEGGRRVERLTAHVDILPTFIDLCGLEAPGIEFDGTSLRPLLEDEAKEWPDRALVVESQRVVDPVKWRHCAVMTDRWRLVNGEELYDMGADPGQKDDQSGRYPEVVQKLRAAYEGFWAGVSADHGLDSHLLIGADMAPVVKLSSHDWLVEGVPWNQPQIMHGLFAKEGRWTLEVAQDGVYEFSLRRWPAELDKPINDANGYHGFDFTEARLRIGELDETKPIPRGAREVTFRVPLRKGVATLSPLFTGGGVSATPYYVYATHRPQPGWQTSEGMGIPRYDPRLGRKPPQELEQDRPGFKQ